MMGKEIDPSDIGKHPRIIRVAQNDMAQTDVLVCGKCHGIFNFIDMFQEHKEQGCEKDSEFKDTRETKPKVWAFLLWKAAQLNSQENSGEATNSWKLYQQWVKMDDSVRETWIVAGKTIQSFARMGQGNLQEMPVKITKTVVDNSSARGINQQKPGPRIIDNKQIFKKEPNTENDEDLTSVRTDQNHLLRKPISQITATKPPGNVIANRIPNRRANRTVPNTSGQDIEEETVEKIIAKRFNPRRKMHEYLVKWEGYPHDQNTWEPQTHLESCPQLLDTFEKQLARQKEQRAAQAAKQLTPLTTPAGGQTTSPAVKNTQVNPPRQNQILRNNIKSRYVDTKPWVSQDESVGGALKRKLDNSEDLEESGAVDDPGDGVENIVQPAKKLKNGNTILQVDSSRDMKISQVPTPMNKTVNGSIKPTHNEASAEVIITKDTQSSGIVKKADIAAANTQKPEAQVRILPKGDSAPSGIVRVNKIPPGGITAGQTRITQISSGGHQRTFSNSSTPSPQNNIGQNKILQRPNVNVSPNTSQQASKTIINRVAGAQTENAKAITPEQKIIQLSQKNDLKVTKKIVHSTNSKNQILLQTSSQTSLQKVAERPDDPFPEPQSPPRPLTLCPVTGKVLAQAEGEPSPAPSPEPEKKSNEVNPLQNQRANITSVGILQTTDIHTDHQGNAEAVSEEIALATAAEGSQHILTSEDGTPLLVTGEDGTIYQVAGKNAEGQTILIAQGADGEQQFAYLAAEEGEEGDVLTLDNAVAEAVAQMLPEQQAAAAGGSKTQFILKQPDGSSDSTGDLTIQTEGGDSQDGNIPAEVVQADLPSPGGTRRVVLLLQDGTFMMTEMQDDEYQALNIVT